MKTTISITGQVSGNHTLKSALSTVDSVETSHFQDYRIEYPTKKQAVKALSDAFQQLKAEELDYYKEGGISYMRGYSLSYDASRAVICE